MSEPAKKGLVPMMRFPEFRDAGEWEQKKLSAVATLASSKRVHLSDYVPSGIPFFRGKEISLLRNSRLPDDLLYISEEHYDEIKEKYGVPQIGDILITAVGTLGNVYCVRNSDKFYFKDGNLIWMKNISENSIFLEILLNVKSEDVLSSAIGSSQKALTMVELNKLEFRFPKKEEQQKIADCLSSIDELVTAQTQKVEALKAHKKGLMQQLFPAEGETVPQLRFPEFRDAGEWKIKPLDKLFTIGNGKDYKHLSTGDIPVYGSGGYMLSVNDYLYDGESVCIGRKGTINNPMFLTGKFWTVDTLFYTHSFKACSPKFIYLIFQNINWLTHNEAGGVPSLSKANISKIEVAVPEPDEQQKIANCLTSIDELITAQTQKLEALKAHKKGLMQQLFPVVDDECMDAKAEMAG